MTQDGAYSPDEITFVWKARPFAAMEAIKQAGEEAESYFDYDHFTQVQKHYCTINGMQVFVHEHLEVDIVHGPKV